MKFNYDMRGGEFLRSKRRLHLPKIQTYQKSDNFFGQTDRPTDRQTLWS